MRLLITRAEPDAARSAAALRECGHDIVLAPLLRIEPVATDFGAGSPATWDAVLITSANALVGSAAAELTALPLIAVGDHSAAAARAAGFADVTSAAGDVDDLAELVRKRNLPRGCRLLYLAGADRAGDLATALTTAFVTTGLSVETRIVYRAVAVRELLAPVRADLAAGRIDGVLHYSRRTAEAYLTAGESLGPAVLAPRHFCLSARIAEPLAAAGASHIRIAARPSEASLLHLIDSA